jgi:rubredoxin
MNKVLIIVLVSLLRGMCGNCGDGCDWGKEAEKVEMTFEDLPDDWVCPECGVGKDMFEQVGG